MAKYNRYKNTLGIKKSTDVQSAYVIKDRETDQHIEYTHIDRLDLISNRMYGNPDYWWVILAANDYQIEFDIEVGEILRIPYPISEVLVEIKEQSN